MPKIKRVRPTAAPGTDLPDRMDYPSPDGEWKLVFHSPREWHMGADGWQAKLFHRSREVTAQHDFFKIAGGKGFRWDRDFYPWSFDSKSLVLVTWDKTPVHLYEIASKSDTQLDYEPGYVRSAQWAPDMDRLLINFTNDGVLVNQSGEQQALVQWGIREGEPPHTYWLKTGNSFFLLARQSANSKTTLTFHSGVDGTAKETHDLDPLDLVPYRSEDYIELPRDRLSLQWIDPPIQSAGSLLDTWNSVRFDRGSNTLFLAVTRPVSSPYREEGELLCKVEQRWVAVELDPE